MVSFDGASGTQTLSKLGLAFVVWTRATLWEKMAFHKLPPLEDFVAARLTREFASPLHDEPGSASSTGVVVRVEARHNY